MSPTPSDNGNDEEKETTEQAAPKIIVDSDWKDQVAKEKAAAAKGSEARVQGSEGEVQGSEARVQGSEARVQGSEARVEGSEAGVEGSEEAVAAERRALPEPSFEILISMLFTQAISALGQMPNPVDGETSVDKAMAKHSIDMIEMIETKTKGNLSDDESKMVREALHALRMAYVSVRG